MSFTEAPEAKTGLVDGINKKKNITIFSGNLYPETTVINSKATFSLYRGTKWSVFGGRVVDAIFGDYSHSTFGTKAVKSWGFKMDLHHGGALSYLEGHDVSLKRGAITVMNEYRRIGQDWNIFGGGASVATHNYRKTEEDNAHSMKWMMYSLSILTGAMILADAFLPHFLASEDSRGKDEQHGSIDAVITSMDLIVSVATYLIVSRKAKALSDGNKSMLATTNTSMTAIGQVLTTYSNPDNQPVLAPADHIDDVELKNKYAFHKEGTPWAEIKLLTGSPLDKDLNENHTEKVFNSDENPILYLATRSAQKPDGYEDKTNQIHMKDRSIFLSSYSRYYNPNEAKKSIGFKTIGTHAGFQDYNENYYLPGDQKDDKLIDACFLMGTVEEDKAKKSYAVIRSADAAGKGAYQYMCSGYTAILQDGPIDIVSIFSKDGNKQNEDLIDFKGQGDTRLRLESNHLSLSINDGKTGIYMTEKGITFLYNDKPVQQFNEKTTTLQDIIFDKKTIEITKDLCIKRGASTIKKKNIKTESFIQIRQSLCDIIKASYAEINEGAAKVGKGHSQPLQEYIKAENASQGKWSSGDYYTASGFRLGILPSAKTRKDFVGKLITFIFKSGKNSVKIDK